MNSKSALFSKKGNAAGFTSAGLTVSGCYSSKAKCWRVWTDLLCRDARAFSTPQEADAYARTLIDATKTSELKWWSS
jgi:hypothetical protein